MKLFLDSNYWIYLFDKTTPEPKYVKDHFNEIFKNYQIVVNVILLIEVMHHLIKRLGTSIGKSKWNLFSSIDFICDSLSFHELDLIFVQFSKYLHTAIGGRDGAILASMNKMIVKKIGTHNQYFKQIEGIKVIDPIKS